MESASRLPGAQAKRPLGPALASLRPVRRIKVSTWVRPGVSSRGQLRTPSNKTLRSRRMVPGEVALFFSSYQVALVLTIASQSQHTQNQEGSKGEKNWP